MNWSWLAAFVSALVVVVPSVASAHDEGHALPDRNDDPSTRAASWQTSGSWQVSSPDQPPNGGTRVAAIFDVRDDRHVPLEARGLEVDASGRCIENDDEAGSWHVMEETFAEGELRVAVVDLGEHFACAQLRMRGADSEQVGNLQWELLVPRYPDAGKHSRAIAVETPEPLPSIGSELLRIGVKTREEWGARPTQCTAVENNWYRMAIHHTAGPQTASGTVEARIRGTQAYAMDSGTFCDIPYQMLVGFDGSLWEGRGLILKSGATGGGNNDGNLAVCFVGCYHKPDSACVGGVGHDVTTEMMVRGQLLVQTLVRLFDISTAPDNIRGHRDWPGNSTACPGSLLHPRLDELRADLAWFSANEVSRSWGDAPVEVEVGQSHELWIELENTGGLAWEPGETFLAPTDPRDQDSPLHDASWPSAVRAATLSAPVSPGEIGRFVFSVAPGLGEEFVQAFGLVHEGVTWFADSPWGGGPSDDLAVVSVVGIGGSGGGDEAAEGGDGDPTGPGDSGPDGDSSAEQSLPPGYGSADAESGACTCSSRGPDPFWAGAGLLMLVACGRGRRRRAD